MGETWCFATSKQDAWDFDLVMASCVLKTMKYAVFILALFAVQGKRATTLFRLVFIRVFISFYLNVLSMQALMSLIEYVIADAVIDISC